MVWEGEHLVSQVQHCEGLRWLLGFSLHSFKKGRKRKVEVKCQPEALSFSLKFPRAVHIPVSSFHSPTSLHREERGVERLNRGILVQAPTLSCCVT